MNKRCSTNRVKYNGEVFTPQPLVDTMLRRLVRRDPKLFEPRRTFLDTSAGDGNILIRVLHAKLRYAKRRFEVVPVRRILRSLYGVEIMADNAQRCRERLLEAVAEFKGISFKMALCRYGRIVARNIVCHDGLTWDYERWQPREAPLPLFITFSGWEAQPQLEFNLIPAAEQNVCVI